MKQKKWLIPDVIDPAEKVCVQIEVPNDTKHIAAFWGALEQLGKAYNWEDSFVTGSQTAYVWQAAIEQAAQQVRFGANCMLDCDDVEDCLETSTIINIIEGDVTTNETNITNNETDITNNLTEITNIITGGNDTNVYPDLPTQSEPDELCGASHEVARQIIALVEQTVIDADTITVADYLLAAFAVGGWLAAQLELFWDYIFDNEPALTGVDFDVYQDQLAEALYCADLDVTQAVIDLDPAIPALRRDALVKGMESVTDAQVALWAFVGSLDDTQDCGSFACTEWCHTFDFTVAEHGFVLLPHQEVEEAGVWVDGSGWGAIETTDEEYTLLGEMQFSEHEITSVQIKVQWGPNEIWSGITLYGRKSTGPPSDVLDTDPVDTPFFLYTLDWTGVEDYIAIPVWVRQRYQAGMYLTEMTITGTGSNPFGDDNC